MLDATGTLKFEMEPLKLWLEVDPEIARLARALIPKALKVKAGKYPPHITVLRNEKPTWVPKTFITDRPVKFQYNPEVQHIEGSPYYWLNVDCVQMFFLRRMLGLPGSSELTRPPSGEEFFHITIGNTKL